ncbi:MAG: hypothetical protein JSV80_14590 [Acidobacteriota bacterium]|nr:MAG: hypothetical protein JSV80_14590 [Acidobacteriota bacterium]
MKQDWSPKVSSSIGIVLVIVGVALCHTPVCAQDDTIAQLEALRDTAVGDYNARNWQQAADAADQYAATLEAAELPRAGADFALVSFIGGHARFELWKEDPDTFAYDYKKDVLGAMHESLRILQDDPFFKYNVLGNAYYEKLKKSQFQDLELENAANWYMYKALLARSEELDDVERTEEKYTAFVKYVLLYIGRAFEMARESPVPNLYLVRVREACRLGFGSEFDDRFNQLYQVVGFDNGNVRAGVLWQTGLDMMASEDSSIDDVITVFREAAQATRGQVERAEVYRQLADYASRQDDHKYKLQAVEYGRLAFRLNPENTDIQVQYGTSLHVVSYAHYSRGRYEDALQSAREATSFEWEGDEVAFFDLSRAEANFGDKINALKHAEMAFDKARRKFAEEELQPYRQNYINILRQFGLSAKADQLEADGQGS